MRIFKKGTQWDLERVKRYQCDIEMGNLDLHGQCEGSVAVLKKRDNGISPLEQASQSDHGAKKIRGPQDLEKLKKIPKKLLAKKTTRKL